MTIKTKSTKTIDTDDFSKGWCYFCEKHTCIFTGTKSKKNGMMDSYCPNGHYRFTGTRCSGLTCMQPRSVGGGFKSIDIYKNMNNLFCNSKGEVL